MNTVVIIGGGASGMMAALTAAENEENKVILLERQQRVGRKLLCTGNGRCNLTNTGASPENYHGERADFVIPCLESFTPEDALGFFRSLGLVTVTEYGGRVYPLSNSANSVLDVLRLALMKPNIELRCSCRVTEIKRKNVGFRVITETDVLDADFVIVACGGAAGAKLGGVTDGYELLKALGHRRTALRPTLVQLITDPTYPRALKGVRAMCRASLYLGDSLLKSSSGEMQFTENGVSGPAAFDVSRAASEYGKTELRIDFLDGTDKAETEKILIDRVEKMPELSTDELLTGIVHNRLGRMLIKYAGLGGKLLRELSESDIKRVMAACTDFRLPVSGTEDFDHAQVTAGGIKTGAVNPATMESLLVPGLFICGELLDVDGDCGGYNLQWAWASGRAAGRLGK